MEGPPGQRVKIFPDALSETSSAGPPPYSSHEIRKRVVRRPSQNLRVISQIDRSWTPDIEGSEVLSSPASTANNIMPGEEAAPNDSTTKQDDSILDLQEVLQTNKRPDVILEHRVRRLEKWATFLPSRRVYFGDLASQYQFVGLSIRYVWVWGDAGTKMVMPLLPWIWQIVLGLWIRCQGQSVQVGLGFAAGLD